MFFKSKSLLLLSSFLLSTSLYGNVTKELFKDLEEKTARIKKERLSRDPNLERKPQEYGEELKSDFAALRKHISSEEQKKAAAQLAEAYVANKKLSLKARSEFADQFEFLDVNQSFGRILQKCVGEKIEKKVKVLKKYKNSLDDKSDEAKKIAAAIKELNIYYARLHNFETEERFKYLTQETFSIKVKRKSQPKKARNPQEYKEELKSDFDALKKHISSLKDEKQKEVASQLGVKYVADSELSLKARSEFAEQFHASLDPQDKGLFMVFLWRDMDRKIDKGIKKLEKYKTLIDQLGKVTRYIHSEEGVLKTVENRIARLSLFASPDQLSPLVKLKEKIKPQDAKKKDHDIDSDFCEKLENITDRLLRSEIEKTSNTIEELRVSHFTHLEKLPVEKFIRYYCAILTHPFIRPDQKAKVLQRLSHSQKMISNVHKLLNEDDLRNVSLQIANDDSVVIESRVLKLFLKTPEDLVLALWEKFKKKKLFDQAQTLIDSIPNDESGKRLKAQLVFEALESPELYQKNKSWLLKWVENHIFVPHARFNFMHQQLKDKEFKCVKKEALDFVKDLEVQVTAQKIFHQLLKNFSAESSNENLDFFIACIGMLDKSPTEDVFSKIWDKIQGYKSFLSDPLVNFITCCSALPYDDQGNALREKFLPQLSEKMSDLPSETRNQIEKALSAKSPEEVVKLASKKDTTGNP